MSIEKFMFRYLACWGQGSSYPHALPPLYLHRHSLGARYARPEKSKGGANNILPCWLAKASNGWRLSSAGSGRFNPQIRPPYGRFWDSNSA